MLGTLVLLSGGVYINGFPSQDSSKCRLTQIRQSAKMVILHPECKHVHVQLNGFTWANYYTAHKAHTITVTKSIRSPTRVNHGD